MCTPVNKILNKIETAKNNFKSQKKDDTEPVIEVEKNKMSFNDLKNQFIIENPTWSNALISIPTTLLLTYMKTVDNSVTKEDVRNYLQGEFKDALKQKKDSLRSDKITNIVEDIFKRFKEEKISH